MGGGCKTYHESWFRGAGNGCVITTTGSECHFGGLGGLFVSLFGGGDVIGIGIGMCFEAEFEVKLWDGGGDELIIIGI